MKMNKKLLSILLIISSATFAKSQTPYDDFAPTKSTKKMLQLPATQYKAVNPDPAAAIKYVLFDKENLTLAYFSNTDSAVHTYALNPTDAKWWSIDTLSAKYPNLSPYCFAGNNPIRNVDLDGKDIIVLLDKEGAGRWGMTAGHAAMLIGNDKTGWQLVSKNGTTENMGIMGKSDLLQIGDDPKTKDKKENTYAKLEDFYKDNKEKKYDLGFRIASNAQKDEDMLKAGIAAAKSDYDVLGENCMKAVKHALKAGEFKILPEPKVLFSIFGAKVIDFPVESIFPNTEFWQIQMSNKGDLIDINKERVK